MWLTIPLLGLRAGVVRPELSGEAEHVDVDRFRVWFTREGGDAVGPSDEDDDGLPDLVDVVADTLAGTRAAYDADGWRPLADDDGSGGSAAIDVYLAEIDANGYAVPAGDSCFLMIAPRLVVGGRVAESVVAHELHHCVEFRYTTTADTWLYEAAATTEQYARVRDLTLDYALSVLWIDRLQRPEVPLDHVDGRMEYAAFAWMKYWWERDGAEYARLPALWEALAEEPRWRRALGAEADRLWGEDLGGAFLGHAEWNAFACAADDGAHYLDDPLGCIADVQVPVTPWDGGPLELELAAFTSVYLELPDGREARCDGARSAVAGDRFVVSSDVATTARCSTYRPSTAPHGCSHGRATPGGQVYFLLTWVTALSGRRRKSVESIPDPPRGAAGRSRSRPPRRAWPWCSRRR